LTERQLPLPEPSAGVEDYVHERAVCLSLDKRKAENYRRYQESARRSATVDYLPVKLDIENVSRCNFACTMCAVSKWPKRKRAEDMSLDAFKQLIDEQHGLVEIKLNGLGEALMQGDDYFEMIRYARSKRIWVRMTTNASLLHMRGNYRKLIDSGVNEIDISIDGADKATFESIRRGSKFEQVVENCKLLNGYARSKNLRRTKMWTLVQEENYRRLDEHVMLAQDMGFRHLVFSLNLHGWGDPALEERNRKVTVDERVSDAYLWSLVDQGSSANVRVSFWRVNEKFDTDALEHRCPWPFERAVVTSDLRTVPCCMIGDPEMFEIGRGSGRSFTDLWGSEEYLLFRRAHLEGKIPQVCKGCYK
jgi:pyrroloquinoline quinone biosynthesis protein E